MEKPELTLLMFEVSLARSMSSRYSTQALRQKNRSRKSSLGGGLENNHFPMGTLATSVAQGSLVLHFLPPSHLGTNSTAIS
jgi:hypothetical protein